MTDQQHNMSLKEKIVKNKAAIIVISLSLFSGFLLAFAINFYLPKSDVNNETAAPPAGTAEDPLAKPVFIPKPELITALHEIDTHDELINKLNADFVFQERDDRHVRYPQEFFELKQGNELDFALFTAHALRYRMLGEVAVARYRYETDQNQENIGTVVIFRGRDLPPKYIAFGQEGARAFDYGWSFDELWQKEEERIGAKITGHRTHLLWPLPRAEDIWSDEWRAR